MSQLNWPGADRLYPGKQGEAMTFQPTDAGRAEARAPYDRLTADLRKLAEELEGEARACFEEAERFVDDGLYRDLRGRALAKSQAADRLCAVVAATEEAKA